MSSPKVRLNRLLILAASAAGILLLCCAGVIAMAPYWRRIVQAPFWKTDAPRAAQVAQSMFDYDLPPGYQELKVLTVQSHDGAVIIAHRERPADLIYVERVLDGIIENEEWKASYETRLSAEMGGGRYTTRMIGIQNTTVRSQPTTLRLFEGTDENGRAVRQVVCGFAGKDGDLLLGMVAGQDTWDQGLVENFLRSLR